MVLACGGRPFPQVAVHVVHAVPAAALFLAPAALHGLGVRVALVLLVAVAIRETGLVFAAACRLPFVDGAQVLACLLAEFHRLFLAHHVARVGVGFVRVFVGVYANRLSADGNGVGVLPADVVRCHVVLGFFPRGAVSDRVFGVEEHAAGLVVFHGLARLLRVERVTDGEECLALDFVALDFQLDGVVVAACGRYDFGSRGRLVGGSDAVLYAFLFEGIEASLFEFREAVGDCREGIVAGLVGVGDAVAYVLDAIAHMAQAVLVYLGLERGEAVGDAEGIGDAHGILCEAVCDAGRFGEAIRLHLLDATQAVEDILLPCLKFGFLLLLQGFLLHLVELALHYEKAQQQKEHDYQYGNVLLLSFVFLVLRVCGLRFFFFVRAHSTLRCQLKILLMCLPARNGAIRPPGSFRRWRFLRDRVPPNGA